MTAYQANIYKQETYRKPTSQSSKWRNYQHDFPFNWIWSLMQVADGGSISKGGNLILKADEVYTGQKQHSNPRMIITKQLSKQTGPT